jgi:hypothetical protein
MKTFARKNQTTLPIVFPESWSKNLEQLLASVYSAACKEQSRGFKTYAASFPDELLLIVSWMALDNLKATPISLFLSLDINEATSDEETLQKLVDKVGLFFDELTGNSEDIHEYFEPLWQERSERGMTFYFKVSRENVALTLEANKLLGDDEL